MRLPWPFRRSSPDRHLDAPRAGMPVQRRAEWRNLPALGETIGPPPLVAPNSPFAGGLSINPPEPTLAPLGHHRSLDAPAGMALGLAKPVSRQADGPAVGSRPVANRWLRQRLQRRAESAAVPAAADWPAEQADGSPAPQPVAPAPAALAPIRRAPAVAREAAVRSISLTTAPADLHAPSSAAPAGAGLQRAAPPVPPNYNAVQSARSIRSMLSLGGGAEATGTSAPVQRAPSASPASAASATAARGKLSLAQSRRAGLGAPLAAKPGPGVQRHADGATDNPAMAAAGPVSSVQLEATTGRGAPSAAPSAGIVGGLGAALQRTRADVGARSGAAQPTDRPTHEPLAFARSTGRVDPNRPVAPTYTASLQRASESAAASPAAGIERDAGVAPLLGLAPRAMTTNALSAEPAQPGAPAGSSSTPASTDGPPRLRVQRRRASDEAAPSADEPAAAAGGDGLALTPATQRAPSEPNDQATATATLTTQRAPAPGSSASAPLSVPASSRQASGRAQSSPVRHAADGGLFGSRALVRASAPPTGVQRAAAGRATPTAAGAGAPVRVLRDASVAGAATQLKAKAFTHAGDVYLPAHHGPLDGRPARSLLAHELTHVQQQREYGAALPAEHTLAGQRLERAAQAAEASGSAPLNLPLAAPGSPRTFRSNAVAQRSTAAGSAAAGAESDEGSAGPMPGTTGSTSLVGASVQRETETTASAAPPPAPGAAGTPDDPEQLDQLASKLWERFRHRLRRELLADRERAGMAADLSR